MEKGKLDDALYSTLTNGARKDELQWRVNQREKQGRKKKIEGARERKVKDNFIH